MRKQLFLKLRPLAAGNHSHLGEEKKLIEKLRHLVIQRRFALGERTVQVKDNEPFHGYAFRNLGSGWPPSRGHVETIPAARFGFLAEIHFSSMRTNHIGAANS